MMIRRSRFGRSSQFGVVVVALATFAAVFAATSGAMWGTVSPRVALQRMASDPQERLEKLGRPTAARSSKPPPTRACPPTEPNCFIPSAGRTLPDYLRWLGRDADRIWGAAVRSGGYRWLSAREVQVAASQQVRSKCLGGPVTTYSSVGPFYCAADGRGAVYLPLGWLKRFIFPRTEFRKRDFALAYVVAHEWGHHLQRVLGILNNPKLLGIQLELQADCLAGVWAYSTWTRKLLEAGDIPEAIRLARLVGDAPGTPPNDPNAHGSSAQRASWFKRGYDKGDPAKCKTY